MEIEVKGGNMDRRDEGKCGDAGMLRWKEGMSEKT
jgi:hypothetical protein